MSDVKDTLFKKMKCGDLHHQNKVMLSDVGAGFDHIQVIGTDVNQAGPIDAALLVEDYRPGDDANGDFCGNPDGTFLINIESEDGVYYVTLFDGSDFQITPTQSAAYLGQWYPAKIWSVNVGSTGLFSVGY